MATVLSTRVRSRAGIGAVPFVITLVFFLIAAGVAYNYYTQLEDGRKEVANAKADVAVQRQRALTYMTINQQVSAEVGFNAAQDDSDPVDVIQVRNRITELAGKFKTSDSDRGNMPPVTIGEKMTVEDALKALETGINETRDRIAVLEKTIEDKDVEIAQKEVAKTEAVAVKDKANAEVEQQLKATQTERDENGARADKEAAEGAERVQQLTDEKEKERTGFALDIRKVKDQLGIKNAELDQLKLKEEVVLARAEEMDGKVIDVDVVHNFALIDLGSLKGLRLGTRFDVIRVIHGNVEFHMGVIEVRATHERWAECSVVSVSDPMNPPMPQDYVRNAVYDPQRTREFVFAGSVSNSRYSKEELGKLIEGFGGRLVEKTDITTDVVILGAGYEADDNFKRGSELHLESIREQEMLRQLGR